MALATSDTGRSAPPSVRAELLSIQYLRAAAALGVLVFHASQRLGGGFGAGAAGVDVFFVISGFIMWTVSARRPVAPAAFLLRRATRIIPLYWLVTLAMAGLAVLSPALFPQLKPEPAQMLKSLLFIPYRDPTGVVAPILVAGWTLNYEVFFYGLFALALMLPVRLRAQGLTLGFVALVLIGPVAPRDPALQTYTNPLLLEFVAGVWLAKAQAAGRLPGPRLAFASLAAGLLALGLEQAAGVDVTPLRLLMWGAPALLIVAGALGLEKAGLVGRWPIVKLLGDASYSTYLVHGLAISAVLRLLVRPGLAGGWMGVAVCVAAGLAVGVCCYWAVERPLVRLFHGRSVARPVPAPAVVTTAQQL